MIPKQVLPVFTLTIPSTKKKVNYRQFTVREEKMMLQAQESDDLQLIVNTVKEIIKACVQDVDVDTLALFDIEYIITKIRAKSSGEIIELSMRCENDETHPRIPALIDLEKIEVTFPEGHSKTIELYDGTGVVMRYPTINDLDNLDEKEILDAVAMCIESVYTEEEVYYAADQTAEELRDYIESLTDAQVEKIKQNFFATMPTFKHDLEYTCRECGHKHKKTIKGLASFFA